MILFHGALSKNRTRLPSRETSGVNMGATICKQTQLFSPTASLCRCAKVVMTVGMVFIQRAQW